MFDLGKVECTTALEVELLAALVYERRLRSRREAPPKPQPITPTKRLTFLPPPREHDFGIAACDASAKEIQAATAKQFKLTVNDLLSQRRNHYLCLARHAAVVLAHTLTLCNAPNPLLRSWLRRSVLPSTASTGCSTSIAAAAFSRNDASQRTKHA